MDYLQARKINIISNKNLKSQRTTNTIIDCFKRHGFSISEKYSKDAELNIIVGGDGAFLNAMHNNKFPTIPFVGINTGHLGFFQEIIPEELDSFISKYLLGQYSKEELFLMETKVYTDDHVYDLFSINELFVRAMYSKVMHLDLYIDGNHLEKFSGDGIIVSTPSGSTAYNFSAGGAIVYPKLKSLQITPVAPINTEVYRSLPNSIVVPGDLIIRITPDKRHTNTTLLVNDGMESKFKNIKHIDMKISKRKIYQLNFDKDMYWNNLKDKFL